MAWQREFFRCSHGKFDKPMKPKLKVKAQLALTLALLLAVRAIAPAAAQDALTVAVYDFTTTDKNGASYASKVTACVTADLTLETNLVMLARADLSRALSEQAFGGSGLVNSQAAAKIGQLTGAKVLVSGQVIITEGNHAVLVASIIGTETGRLFAAKVEGGADNWMDLTSRLGHQIARTISAQTTNLTAMAGESRNERFTRIVKRVKGKNRPAVSVLIHQGVESNPHHCTTGEGEFGALLLKAGFTVVDANSERKPDVEITGIYEIDTEPRRSGLFSCRAMFDLKVQDRRTGSIITLDHQESSATDIALTGASRAAQADAVDQLAERILPLLAQ